MRILLLWGWFRRLFASTFLACGLVGAETASAAAPYAFTQSATRITGTNAVLNGMATPNGLASVGWFEWGTKTNYENRTMNVSAGNGNDVVFMTNQIAGLVSGIPYHFRFAVSNVLGVVYGADQVFACGRKVQAWGDNANGQIGVPLGLSNVVAVAGGATHSLALKNDGKVIIWGASNSYGITNMPANLSNVVAIAAGGSHSLGLKSDGTVAAWGDISFVPTGLTNVVAISAGGHHNLALKSDGKVVAWGDNIYGQTNVPAGLKNVVALAGGLAHSLALRDDGTVVAWGSNAYGQTNAPAGLANVVAVAAGVLHSLALKSDGTAEAWGVSPPYSQNTLPSGLSNAVTLTGGAAHTMALKSDGTVIVGGYYQVMPGFYDDAIEYLPSLNNVVAIASGEEHSLAVLANQTPVANSQTATWGKNSDMIITLSAIDGDGDSLSYKITSLPTTGTLYQFNAGIRGAAISSINTWVSDSAGRIIFFPVAETIGVPYTGFEFLAKDPYLESYPATVTINIIATTAPVAVTRPATMVTATNAVLNGMAVPNGVSSAWFEWGTTLAYGIRRQPRLWAKEIPLLCRPNRSQA